MNGYNPDFHGTYADHKPDCHLRVHGGEGKNCDCGFLDPKIEPAPIEPGPLSTEAPF